MVSRISRAGREHTSVAVSPSAVLDALGDPTFLTPALGDLLDQDASSSTPPVRWVLPAVEVGIASYEVVLRPRWTVTEDHVVIDAPSAQASDVQLQLQLRCTPRAASGDTRLTIMWELSMALPLPRIVLPAVRPALDATIPTIARRITSRTAAALDAL